jgi:hypothetical protein
MNWTHLITIVGATILVGSEVVALSFAGGWAIAGLLGLGDTGAYILEAVGVLIGLYLVWSFWRSATKVEPITR